MVKFVVLLVWPPSVLIRRCRWLVDSLKDSFRCICWCASFDCSGVRWLQQLVFAKFHWTGGRFRRQLVFVWWFRVAISEPGWKIVIKVFFLNFVCCSWLSFCGVIEYFFFSLYRFFFYLKDIQLWFVFIMSVFSLFKRNWFEVFQVNWLREDFVFTVYVYEASV